MRAGANSLFRLIRGINVPMTATVAMPAGRYKRTDKETNGGRRIYALARRFLFAFSGDATITNNSTICKLRALCTPFAGVYVVTTACSLIVKRAFIFSPFRFLWDFLRNNMSLYNVTKKKLLIYRIFLIIPQSDMRKYWNTRMWKVERYYFHETFYPTARTLYYVQLLNDYLPVYNYRL